MERASVLSLFHMETMRMFRMPGHSFQGPLPPLTKEQMDIRDQLSIHIEQLAGKIGERNIPNYHNLQKAAQYIESIFKQIGYIVSDQSYEVTEYRNFTVKNVIAELPGTSHADEIIIVGAHYDTVVGSPGADDNASGIAAILEIARLLKSSTFKRTVRFIAFVNEEPPYFYTDQMGSLRYARFVKQKNENIVAMLSLESIGFYSTKKNSQHYPLPFGFFYPNTGDFIGFVSNLSSRALIRFVMTSFRQYSQFPSEGVAAPSWIPGVSWSDQWSFWKQGYQALMVTGTALYRNPHYHMGSDIPETIDYLRTACVVSGLIAVLKNLANRLG